MMRVFEGFNGSNGDVCPVCKTAKNTETVLVPIPGTEDDGIMEAKQVHKKCYDLIEEMNDNSIGEMMSEKVEHDLYKLCDKFTEIVAMRFDVYEQRIEGIWPPNTDLDRWKRRYRGTPQDELPPYTVEMNTFRAEVDQFVSMLMQTVVEAPPQ